MRIADQLAVDCPVFYVDNVAEYYIAAPSIDLINVPSFAPPFDQCFVEHRCILGDGYTWKIACMFQVEEMRVADPDGVRWVVSIGIMVGRGADKTRAYRHPLMLYVRGDGSLARTASSEPDSAMRAKMSDSAGPALLALSFMHCKNVRHVENEPTGQRTRRRQGKPPLLRYYTLEIDPMKETLRREGNVETVGLAKALHICRGHFKDYRASGLFGKIKGIFWWGPALRGTPEAGTVVKDYAVEAPSHTSAQVI